MTEGLAGQRIVLQKLQFFIENLYYMFVICPEITKRQSKTRYRLCCFMVIKLTLVLGIPYPLAFFFADDSINSTAIIIKLQNAIIITYGPHNINRMELCDVSLHADFPLDDIKRVVFFMKEVLYNGKEDMLETECNGYKAYNTSEKTLPH